MHFLKQVPTFHSGNTYSIHKEMIQIGHNKFLMDKSKTYRDAVERNVTKMLLKIETDNENYGVDQKLFYYGNVKVYEGEQKDKIHEINTFKAIHNLAEEALREEYNLSSSSFFLALTQEILERSIYTNDTKGRIAEAYCISTLEAKHKYHFFAKSFSDGSICTFSGNITHVIRFGGNKLPNINKESFKNDLLLIPRNTNYPNIDLFIWKPHKNNEEEYCTT